MGVDETMCGAFIKGAGAVQGWVSDFAVQNIILDGVAEGQTLEQLLRYGQQFLEENTKNLDMNPHNIHLTNTGTQTVTSDNRGLKQVILKGVFSFLHFVLFLTSKKPALTLL